MPNFKKLAKNYEENALAALKVLASKPSVYDESSIKEGAPYGDGVKQALDTLARWGKDYGFEVDTCEGRATEIAFGEGGPLIGIYAHADVVPASGKWDNPPFSPKVYGEGKEAKIIARGVSDDKGPLIAALFAIKLLKDNGLINGYRVRLVAGGDEERGSSCLEYYFNKLKKPHCDYGFTPDADFPLIYAEKGIHHARAIFNKDLSPIIAMDGGTVSNAVCDRLIVTLPTDKDLEKALKEKGIDADITPLGPIMMVAFKGKTAHGSRPDLGDNAALKAFAFLGEHYEIDALSRLYLALNDCHGKSFGGYSNSKELGESTFNYGVVKYESAKKKLTFTIDYRYGEDAKPEVALEAFKKNTGCDLIIDSVSPVLLFDKKTPLVSTLMKSYRRMTFRLFDKPIAIGGGTYAKEAKNCVAYGSAFPGHDGAIHSPNEYLFLNDLYAQIAIYADAIYSLGKLKK